MTTPLASSTVLAQPVPTPDGLDTDYWEGLKAHELRAQKCRACGKFQWGPEWICHRCRSFDLAFEAVEGTGVVYSWERVWHPVPATLADVVPYVIVLVELPHADGIRMLGNLVGDQEVTPTIGAPCRVVFDDREGYTLAQWEQV